MAVDAGRASERRHLSRLASLLIYRTEFFDGNGRRYAMAKCRDKHAELISPMRRLRRRRQLHRE